MKLTISTILMIVFAVTFSLTSYGEIVVLFDEDAKDEAGAGDFVGLFISHDAGSTVTVTKDSFISGKVSAFCTPSQSYNPTMNGWSYSVAEYPYITFAWKKDGGAGIMLQLAYDNTWAYRYHSGVNVTNWLPSVQLEQDIPKDWILYTRDLSKDYPGDWKLTGVALTPWDGVGGYYDHILLHSKPDEGKIANAVDSTQKVATVWGNIKQL